MNSVEKSRLLALDIFLKLWSQAFVGPKLPWYYILYVIITHTLMNFFILVLVWQSSLALRISPLDCWLPERFWAFLPFTPGEKTRWNIRHFLGKKLSWLSYPNFARVDGKYLNWLTYNWPKTWWLRGEPKAMTRYHSEWLENFWVHSCYGYSKRGFLD